MVEQRVRGLGDALGVDRVVLAARMIGDEGAAELEGEFPELLLEAFDLGVELEALPLEEVDVGVQVVRVVVEVLVLDQVV